MVLEDVTEHDYAGAQTKLPKILLNGNNVCMLIPGGMPEGAYPIHGMVHLPRDLISGEIGSFQMAENPQPVSKTERERCHLNQVVRKYKFSRIYRNQIRSRYGRESDGLSFLADHKISLVSVFSAWNASMLLVHLNTLTGFILYDKARTFTSPNKRIGAGSSMKYRMLGRSRRRLLRPAAYF
ncbi:hypothetical protein KC327_g9 [Hortaea werneckii]|nr:hypothetical protein KC327_g9 [Hortaea werneckii]